MKNSLEGKVAIVSGSGRGIGQAVALRLASEGACVVVNDLDSEPAKRVVDKIIGAGGKAVACTGSITADGFPERFVNTAFNAFGGLDIIVNNAGYTWDSVIQKTSDEQWDAMLDVHLRAPFRVLRAAQPHFKRLFLDEQKLGLSTQRKVVNVSSVAGTLGNAGQSAYASGKAGIIGLTKTLSKEMGRYNVNVNAVAFGLILTRLTDCSTTAGATIRIADRDIHVGIGEGMHNAVKSIVPLGRAGSAEEAAGAVYFLCGPDSDYVSGEVLTCAGGL